MKTLLFIFTTFITINTSIANTIFSETAQNDWQVVQVAEALEEITQPLLPASDAPEEKNDEQNQDDEENPKENQAENQVDLPSSPASQTEPSDSSISLKLPNVVTTLWQRLETSDNQCPELFDYYPEGGMRIFYCHLKTYLNFQQLRQLAKMPIFLQGPHDETQLTLDEANNFGHYNPAFVTWLVQNFIPTSDDSNQKHYQSLYDQYVKSLARTFYITHQRLLATPTYLQQEQAAYQAGIASQTLPEYYYEKYYDFADLHQTGYDGNVVKTCVAFWLRRFIDGTADEFFTGLQRLLQIYDIEFVEKIEHNSQIVPSTRTSLFIWKITAIINKKMPPFTFRFFGTHSQEQTGLVNVTRLEIYQANQKTPWQVIDHLDTISLFDEEVGIDFKIVDLNFDGYQDIGLMAGLAEGPIPYIYWLFTPTQNQFVENAELNGLSLEVDAENQQLISSWQEDALRHHTYYYQFIDNKLTLVRHETVEYSLDEEGVYQLTVRERINGEMKVVATRRVVENVADEIQLQEPQSPPRSDLEILVRNLWLNLNQLAQDCPNQSLSYRKAGKNLLNFYCQLKKHFLAEEKLSHWAKLPIFLKGPHHQSAQLKFGLQLNLNAPASFGYYNPAFVKWLNQHFIPGAEDPVFRKRTQSSFDSIVKPLARTFYLVHELLFQDLDFLRQEQTAYLTRLKDRQLPKDYFLKYLNFKDLSKQGYIDHEVATAVAFWLRRVIDGSEPVFFSGLQTLMMSYDGEFATKHARHSSEWHYKANIYTKPPQFTFKLIGQPETEEQLNEISRVERIEIYQHEEIYPFQTIKGLNMQLFADDEGFETKDMNFDGYQDFRIGNATLSHYYFLFDPQQQRFVRNLALEKLEQLEHARGALEFDDRQQQIQLTWREETDTGDWEDGIYGINYYEFFQGKPRLLRQKFYQVVWEIANPDAFDEPEMVREFTIVTLLEKRAIMGDEMKLLEQKLVPGNLIKKKFGLEYEAMKQW
jgi:hypothetical protein